MGADEFIDYGSQRFEQVVEKVDCVLAAVGGDSILERSLKVLRRGGYLISLLDEIDSASVEERGINYQRWWVRPNARDLKEIALLIDGGELKVPIEKVFTLEQVRQAHELSQSQRVRGKIVLNVAA